MEWSEEEIQRGMDAQRKAPAVNGTVTWAAQVRAIMTCAVELKAARGGTMTAERLATALNAARCGSGPEVDRLREHLATLGARIAVLEADVAKARQSEDVWRKRLEAAAVALGAHGAGQVGRLDIVARVRILLDNTAQSRQREECIRRRSLEAGNLERLIAEHGLPAAMRWVVDGEEPQELMDPTPDRCTPCLCTGDDHPHRLFGAIWRCSNCGEIGRWPCSPTCTHDDAATPGHLERVKARSEALEAMHPNGSCTCAGEGTCAWCDKMAKLAESAGYDEGLSRGWDDGSEAMRAACWESVDEVLTINGLAGPGRSPLWNALKAAIEAATP